MPQKPLTSDPKIKIISTMIRESIKNAAKGAETSEKEIDSLTQLCMMGVGVDCTENPRELIRDIGNKLLDHIVRNRNNIESNKIFHKIHMIFLIEWSHRNGYLEGDWIWQWSKTHKGQGNLHYNSRIPIEEIEFPKSETSMVLASEETAI